MFLTYMAPYKYVIIAMKFIVPNPISFFTLIFGLFYICSNFVKCFYINEKLLINQKGHSKNYKSHCHPDTNNGHSASPLNFLLIDNSRRLQQLLSPVCFPNH
jgi:hypothetical protein